MAKVDMPRPVKPEDLLARLQAHFPEFGADELAMDVRSGERGLHGIMIEFSGEFRAGEATEAQLKGLAHLIEQAVALDDELENAVSTCFLEHFRQIDRQKILYSRLSPEARRHARA